MYNNLYRKLQFENHKYTIYTYTHFSSYSMIYFCSLQQFLLPCSLFGSTYFPTSMLTFGYKGFNIFLLCLEKSGQV